MELVSSSDKIRLIFEDIFQKLRKTVRNNLFLVVMALLMSKNCVLSEIVGQMSKINGNNFHANDHKLNRFLNSSMFCVDDTHWRAHLALVFGLLEERNYLRNLQQIPILIDFTTHSDRFLILSAAIPLSGRAIPIYCSIRNYPKKAGKINQVKMERAFLKALNSMLPRKYKYVLVADRGFGNSRFIKDCTDLGFDYLVRIREDWNVGIDGWEVVSSDEFERYGSR